MFTPGLLNATKVICRQSLTQGIRNKKKKEEQEVQNTLTLKSGEKGYTRKNQQFQEYK